MLVKDVKPKILFSLKELQKERDQLRQLQIQEELKEIDKVKQEIKDIEDKEKVNKENTKRIINEMTRESFLLERRKRKKEKEEEELDKATFHIIKQTTGQLTDMKNQIVQQVRTVKNLPREIYSERSLIRSIVKDASISIVQSVNIR